MKTYYLADKNNGIFEAFQAENDEQAQDYYDKYCAEQYEIYKDENTLEEIRGFHYLLDENENEM